MADLKEIEQKQKEIAELAKQMAGEKDVDELKRMADKLTKKAKDLEKAALGLAAAVTPTGPRNQGGATRVVLTKDQRQRIAEQTGVPMDTLVIEDDAAAWAARMPGMEKRLIEQKALQMAARSIVSEEKAKRIAKIIKELEAIPEVVPEVQRIINTLREDPDSIEQVAKEIGDQIKANANPPPEGM